MKLSPLILLVFPLIPPILTTKPFSIKWLKFKTFNKEITVGNAHYGKFHGYMRSTLIIY